MKSLKLILFFLAVAALLSSIVVSFGSSVRVGDYSFEDCEDMEDMEEIYNGYEVVPFEGISIETTCGPCILGFRMIGVPSQEEPTYAYYTCYYTGNIGDRCYIEHVEVPYPY